MYYYCEEFKSGAVDAYPVPSVNYDAERRLDAMYDAYSIIKVDTQDLPDVYKGDVDVLEAIADMEGDTYIIFTDAGVFAYEYEDEIEWLEVYAAVGVNRPMGRYYDQQEALESGIPELVRLAEGEDQLDELEFAERIRYFVRPSIAADLESVIRTSMVPYIDAMMRPIPETITPLERANEVCDRNYSPTTPYVTSEDFLEDLKEVRIERDDDEATITIPARFCKGGTQPDVQLAYKLTSIDGGRFELNRALTAVFECYKEAIRRLRSKLSRISSRLVVLLYPEESKIRNLQKQATRERKNGTRTLQTQIFRDNLYEMFPADVLEAGCECYDSCADLVKFGDRLAAMRERMAQWWTENGWDPSTVTPFQVADKLMRMP